MGGNSHSSESGLLEQIKIAEDYLDKAERDGDEDQIQRWKEALKRAEIALENYRNR